MTGPVPGTLRVPGASLHYEVRGRGPLLLLVPGGTGGAASFDGIADELAAEYTVVAHDPRGIGRSTLDDPAAEQRVAEHADDALRLLELLSPGEPARVAGVSSGAIAALHLLTAHPGRVERVVAHEPPVVEVLPDAAEHRAFLARVSETFRTRGLMPAMAVFAAGLSKDGRADGADTAAGEREVRAEPLPPTGARAERTMAGLPFFVGRVVPAFMSYAPDVHRLAAVADRLVLACGEDARGELPHRSAAALAERIGQEPLYFPGGHLGPVTHPAGFAAALRKALRA
ncbi:alpha/beta fold hydrolase [Streptomyces sp. NPDC060184]|uniref:alpha/beta fold hydrolase n=1 Tax=Streptomyces sp. NPDC060184 TaxID=3347064 RepID=UPI00364897AF